VLIARVFPACPVDVSQLFHWSGEEFIGEPIEYAIFPDTDLLAWCEVLIDHTSLVWEPTDTFSIAEVLLPVWPPAVDTEGRIYPADGLDGWRFRLGILAALTLQPEQARASMQTILDTPAVPESTWIVPARQFMEDSQIPDNLFLACQAAPMCNLHNALQSLVQQSDFNDPSLALNYLQQHGVVTRVTGYFDFDKDGQDERWMSVIPRPGGKLEFWILTHVPGGVQALFVQIFEDNAPEPYYHNADETPAVVQLESGSGFILERDPISNIAILRFVDVEYARPTVIREALDRARRSLLNGVDPERVLAELLELGASARFAGDCAAFGICAQYYYTLGLAYDLTGELLNAIDSYLIVWRYYPLSPYTLMARLKLELLPATPTFTPTATATMTPTITTTLLPGETVTHTPTPIDTPTTTVTP